MIAVYVSLRRRRTLYDLYLPQVIPTTSDSEVTRKVKGNPVTFVEICMHLTECISGHISLSRYLSCNVSSFVGFLNLRLVSYLEYFWTNSASPLF